MNLQIVLKILENLFELCIKPLKKAVDYSTISDDDELDFDSSPKAPSVKKESKDDSMMDIILPTISKEDIILPSMTESETGSEQKSSELDSEGRGSKKTIRVLKLKKLNF